MKIRYLFAICCFAVLYLSCGSKKEAFDTSSWYFKIKVNNEWQSLPDNLGAFFRADYDGIHDPVLAFGADDLSKQENILLNFNVRVIKFGADSLPITPRIEYSFHYFGYTTNNKKVISSSQGIGQDIGVINLNEFKVVDTTKKFAGYFTGNFSYVDESGKKVTITEGQFNLPRNDQK